MESVGHLSSAAPAGAAADAQLTRVHACLLFVLLAAAMAALFHVNLIRLWHRCNPISGDPEWGHALLVPLISLAYLYLHQPKLRQTPVRPAPMGLLVLVGGILLFTYGICISSTFPGLSAYTQDFGMIITLFGSVLAIFGYAITRIALFPIAYLFCACLGRRRFTIRSPARCKVSRRRRQSPSSNAPT